jgi:hypothetical protein
VDSAVVTELCVGCGLSTMVDTYVFEHRDGRLTDRPLCRECAPPEPMSFEDWLDWAAGAKR